MPGLQARTTPEPDIAFGLRLFNTFAVLCAAALLARITAPGIDHAALATSAGAAPYDVMLGGAVSVNALQFSPAISALVIFEVLRLLLPGMSNWDSEEPGHRGRLGLLVLSLAFALYQGWGVASALEEISQNNVPLVPDPGSTFRAAFALTQVAGTFLLIAGADTITRYGIGSGWWVMIAAMQLAALLPSLLMTSAQLSSGLLDPTYGLAVAAIAAGGAYAAWLLFIKGVQQGRTPARSAADLILPIFLGTSLGSFLYGTGVVAAAFLSREPFSPDMFHWSAPGALAVTAGLIFFFARLRCRTNRQRGWQIAALSCALYAGLEFSGANAGLHAIRADVVIIAVMVGALAWHHWSGGAAARDAA